MEKCNTLCAAHVGPCPSTPLTLEVLTDTWSRISNGSQQAIKTYTIPPDQDPAT